MYRLLLVDDEQSVHDVLRKLIVWEELGFEIVGDCYSGHEAFSKIAEYAPDLVITDISMPDGDGIELIKKASVMNNPPCFIVLSVYGSFDYVKESMRAGAVNYLLKPVNAEELLSTLELAVEQIESLAKMKSDVQTIDMLRQDTLHRILLNTISHHELRYKSDLLGIDLHSTTLCAGLVRPLFNDCNVVTDDILRHSIKICAQILGNKDDHYITVDSYKNIAILIKLDGVPDKVNEMKDILESCANAIKNEQCLDCITSMGDMARSYKEIPASYSSALKRMDLEKFLEEMAGTDEIHIGSRTVFTPDALAGLIADHRLAENISDIRESFEEYINSGADEDLNRAKYLAIDICLSVLDKLADNYDDSSLQTLKYSAFSASYNSDDAEGLCDNFIRYLNRLEAESDSTGSSDYSHTIRLAVDYINSHYSDSELSLKTLASKLYVNPAYLGRQFKVETGVMFSAFLTELRMRVAKKLLQTTALKISSIGEQVGYVNESHFYTVFKKQTGNSPSYYRENKK